jgi:predicted outer membrane repeat protein
MGLGTIQKGYGEIMKKKSIFIILAVLVIVAILYTILTKDDLAATRAGDTPITIHIPEDYKTIQKGINASKDGDEIIVSPGTYVENINFEGKAIILGSLFYTTQDTSYISQTIIDGNQDGTVVTFENEEDSTSVLSGFTITNGHTSYIYGQIPYHGGGICCKSSSPSIANVIITGNSTEVFGGGIFCGSSSPSLVNVTITGNSASDGGGLFCIDDSSPSLANVTIMDNSAGNGAGIYCWGSNPILENVTISDNSASSSGGGIFCQDSSPIFANVTIIGNSAKGDGGGGIYCYHSSPSLVNVTIADNATESYGGGIYSFDSEPSFANVTISANSAKEFGGGIYCDRSSPNLANVTMTDNSAKNGGGIYCESNSSATLVNCISWNNSPQEVEFYNDSSPVTITIAYSDIAGGKKGIVTNNNGTVNWLQGNIAADPIFIDALAGDYHLTKDSPCIDAGTNYFEYDGKVLINLNDDEYYGTAPDMGAYEYGLRD